MTNKIPNFNYVLIDGDVLHYRCSAICDKQTYQLITKSGDIVDEFSKASECKDALENLFDDIPDEDKPERVIKHELMPIEHCKKAFKNQIRNILKATGAKDFKLYLGGKNSKLNFRHQWVATIKKYKSGRATEKPTHFAEMREWIIQEYSPIISNKIESDDRLRIDSQKDFENSVEHKNKMRCRICVATIDKDDYTYPHWLYDWDKMLEPEFISVKAARHWFYTMILMGDSVDSIQGCPRIGKKTAERILDGCTTDEEYWDKVCEQYWKSYSKKLDEGGYFHYEHAYTGEPMKKTPTEIAVEMARLLHMLRTRKDVWNPPFEYEYKESDV